jgi:hypothetical protein
LINSLQDHSHTRASVHIYLMFLFSIIPFAYPDLSFKELIISGRCLPQKFIFSDSFVAEIVLLESEERSSVLCMAIVLCCSCFIRFLLPRVLNIIFKCSQD